MPEIENEPWPIADGDTAVIRRESDAFVGAPPPPPPATPPPDRRIGAGMLLALAVIVLALAGIAIAYLLTHRGTRAQVTTVVVQSTAASGTVRKAPPPSAAKVAMPDLTGMSLAGAKKALGKIGLDSTTTEATSDQPAGTVVDQAPKPGARLARGSTVTLAVARPKPAGATPTTTQAVTTNAATTTATTTTAPAQPATATVPDVSGQQEAAAVQALSRAGVLASLFFVPGKDPLGTVEQQAKPSGTTVSYHAHVQINVSKGPGDKPSAQVPNVVGQTLQQALASLNGASLRLIFVKLPVTARSQAGKVVQQSPLGGEAPQNAQVVVYLGAFRG